MKKFVIMCLVAVISLSLLIGIWAAVKPANTRALPDVGSKTQGFTVTERGRLEITGDETVLFEHDKTGAQVYYIASNDINRFFSIAFKTPKLSDNGIQHIFEHATTSGSEKYPSANIWFPVRNRTYNTYMNALTGNTVTMYPLMSLSDEQLIKLADMYLDGLFNPLITTEERIFKREAWRYELAGAEAPIIVTGTVYNEMKGSNTLESVAMVENTKDALFPDSIISNSIGGMPEEITDITWQDLNDYRDAYYHPSNSLTVLYGDVDYTAYLKLLDGEYFAGYRKKDIEIETGMIEPPSGPVEKTYRFPVEASAKTEDASVITYSAVADGAATDEADAFDFALSLLTHDSSPMMADMREKLPGASVSLSGDFFAAPVYYAGFTATGVDEEDKELFKSIIDENIGSVIRDGFDKELVDAVLAQTKLSFLLTAGQAELGLELGMLTMYNWSVYGETDFYNDYMKSIEIIEAKADEGYLEDMLKKYFADNPHKAVAITVPDPGKIEEEAAKLEAELAEMKAAMTEEEIDALVAATADMATWNAEEVPPELIEPLQAVSVDNLPEEIADYEINERNADGVRYMTTAVNVPGIGQTNILFNTTGIPLEDLHYLKLYTDLIGNVGTSEHSVEEINVLITRYLSSLSVSATYYENADNSYTPTVGVSWQSLNEDYAKGTELLNEILFDADMTDTETIKNFVSRLKTGKRNEINIDSYLFLRNKAYATAKEKYAYNDYIHGPAYYQFLIDAEKALAANPEAFCAKLTAAAKKIAVRDKISVLYAGDTEGIKIFDENIDAILEGLAEGTVTTVNYAPGLNEVGSEAMIVDSEVQYNAIYSSLEALGIGYSGKLLPLSLIIDDLYLTPRIRYDIGAYGSMPYLSKDGILFISYMDPSITETNSVYDEIDEFISELDISQEEADGYIIQAYSSYAKPEGVIGDAMNAMTNRLGGKPDDEKLQILREMKTLTVKDIKDLADEFKKLAEDGYRATAGSASAIEANADLFEQVININTME